MTQDEFGDLGSATGILQCLRMLAEEAATLNLRRTLDAINEALEACQTERGAAPTIVCRGNLTVH